MLGGVFVAGEGGVILENLEFVGFVLEKWRVKERFRELKNQAGKFMSYIDLLTQIKNAQAVKKEKLKVPFSQRDMEVAEILSKSGFVKSAVKKGRLPKRIIDIRLEGGKDGKKVINGVKWNSKPSRRIYTGYRDLKMVKGGHGLGLISTPKGIMTTKEARKQKLGGELLFEIW